jgi:hypothetical protein
MAKLLKAWDLGLSDVRIERQTVTLANGDKEDIFIPFGVHKVYDVEHSIMLKQESSGCKPLYLVVSPLTSFDKMVVWLLLINELILHPHIFVPILD